MESGASREVVARLAGLPGLVLRPGEPLARRTTLRIGGPAELFAEIASEPALVALLVASREQGLAFHLLGTDEADANFANRLNSAGRIMPTQMKAVVAVSSSFTSRR